MQKLVQVNKSYKVLRMKLTTEQVIARGLQYNEVDVEPILDYLKNEGSIDWRHPDKERVSEKIMDEISLNGGHTISNLFRGNKGIGYAEIVLDVANKLDVLGASEENTIEKNEELIILKMMSDSIENMTETERGELLDSLGIEYSDFNLGSSATMVIQLLLKQYGGFAVYKFSLIVANMFARALLGHGLSFATNMAITRSIGAFLGPIGWIATGAWLIYDLGGPAYRKTIPVILHIAMLRQMVEKRVNITIAGDGSVGKDAFVQAVFNVDAEIDPIAGSTSEVNSFSIDDQDSIFCHNLPGFNDVRKEVNESVERFLHCADLVVLVIDINRGVSNTDIEIYERLVGLKKPLLICLNKVDLPRNEDEKNKLVSIAKERIGNAVFIETALHPDPRLSDSPIGIKEIQSWIELRLNDLGKDLTSLKTVFSQN
jgi:small GTP-binding protein